MDKDLENGGGREAFTEVPETTFSSNGHQHTLRTNSSVAVSKPEKLFLAPTANVAF